MTMLAVLAAALAAAVWPLGGGTDGDYDDGKIAERGESVRRVDRQMERVRFVMPELRRAIQASTQVPARRGSGGQGAHVLRVYSLASDGAVIPEVVIAPVASPEPAPVTEAPRAVVTIPDIICSFSWPCQDALSVAWCESKYDPWAVNPSSGALGLFQLLPYYHSHRFNGDPFDPWVNAAAAYSLWLERGWQPWNVGGCP